MFMLRREQGRIAELEPALSAFVQQYPTMPAWRCGLMVSFADLGRGDDVRREFEHLAGDDFASIPHDLGWLVCMTHLADACYFLRDERRATLLYQLLLPYAKQCVVYGSTGVACSGSVSRYLGLLASTSCDWVAASSHFECALETHRSMGINPWIAHAQCNYGAMLVRRDQRGDGPRALALVDEALATAKALGMQHLIDKVGILKQQAAKMSAGTA
jgi:hypothetical protein